MCPFGGNREEGRMGTHGISQTYHGDVSASDIRRDMGDSRGGSSVGSSGNKVGDDLYKDMAGKSGTMGGVTTNIRRVCRGEGIQGVVDAGRMLGGTKGQHKNNFGPP